MMTGLPETPESNESLVKFTCMIGRMIGLPESNEGR